jgi:hypothetical protein
MLRWGVKWCFLRFEPNGTSQYYSIFRNSRTFPVLQKNAEVIQSVVIVLSSVRWVNFHGRLGRRSVILSIKCFIKKLLLKLF